jgi:hypothetical protein
MKIIGCESDPHNATLTIQPKSGPEFGVQIQVFDDRLCVLVHGRHTYFEVHSPHAVDLHVLHQQTAKG